MFDNICKFLAETFPTDFATWLLGQPIPLTQLSPTELSVDPIRADALILLDSDNLLLHLEFPTAPDPTMPFRMLDYRTRAYRRFPDKAMRQIVIYLKPSKSALVYETTFEIPGTQHQFEVIRLWEHPPGAFLSAPGLLAFASLSQTPDQAETLRTVAAQINQIEDPRIQRNISAATSVLAGLVLEQEVIEQILRSDIMRESVIYQSILAEGRAEGRAEGERSIVLQLLTRRLGTLDPGVESQVTGLSVTQVEALGEALLDFSSMVDLQAWLKTNTIA